MALQSTKHAQINKANATMVTIIAVASFLVVFSLVASKALTSQWAYQGRVIKEKQKAVDQLKTNVKAVDSLVASYSAFVNQPENLIKGNSAGKGDRDGNNARLVLDALPSKYDFPGLTSSIEKLLSGYTINSIEGSDDEVNQAQNKAAATPEPVQIPFSISVNSSYANSKLLVLTLERSIRPIQIQKIELNGADANLQTIIDGITYYQPEKSLNIKTKVVK